MWGRVGAGGANAREAGRARSAAAALVLATSTPVQPCRPIDFAPTGRPALASQASAVTSAPDRLFGPRPSIRTAATSPISPAGASQWTACR